MSNSLISLRMRMIQRMWFSATVILLTCSGSNFLHRSIIAAAARVYFPCIHSTLFSLTMRNYLKITVKPTAQPLPMDPTRKALLIWIHAKNNSSKFGSKMKLLSNNKLLKLSNNACTVHIIILTWVRLPHNGIIRGGLRLVERYIWRFPALVSIPNTGQLLAGRAYGSFTGQKAISLYDHVKRLVEFGEYGFWCRLGCWRFCLCILLYLRVMLRKSCSSPTFMSMLILIFLHRL